MTEITNAVKLSKRLKIGFQDQSSLNAGQKYKRNILQYFRPSLSYNASLRSAFCLVLRDRFTVFDNIQLLTLIR